MTNNQDRETCSQNSQVNLNQVGEFINITQSIFTIAAIIAAAWWFFFQAEISPKVNINHSINYHKIHDDWLWVYVSITLTNLGKMPISLNLEKVWLQKVLPIDNTIEDKIKQNIDLISEKGFIDWPLVGKPYQRAIDIEIYPSESDTLTYEFIIPSYIKTIRLYSFYQKENSIKGWRLASLHKLQE